MKGMFAGIFTASVLALVGSASGTASGSMHSVDSVITECALAVDCGRASLGPAYGWAIDWEVPWFGAAPFAAQALAGIRLEEIKKPGGPEMIRADFAADGFRAAFKTLFEKDNGRRRLDAKEMMVER